MSAPVLLVADDLATIAAIRRFLGREGYELILATSAADAVIAFGHHLPGVVLLDPRVESDRGQVVLEELATHPDGALARVLLLGETVPGFAWPVVPLPPDAATFVPLLEEAMRGGPPKESWAVTGGPRPAASPAAATPKAGEPDPWRATAPKPPGLAPAAALDPSFAPVPDADLGLAASPFEDASPPDDAGGDLPPSSAPPLERAIAMAAAAKLQAREASLARDAAHAELSQAVQRLQEEKELERAESRKTLQQLERLRAELADERGRGGEAKVAAERAHHQGLLAEKDRALESLERDLEEARAEAMQRGHEGEKKLDELKQMARAMESEIERVKKERDLARGEAARLAELSGKLAAAEKALERAEETLRKERERAQAAVGRSSDENSGLQRRVAELEDALEAQKRLTDEEAAGRLETESTLQKTLARAEALETRAFELEARWKEAQADGGRAGEDLERSAQENARLSEQARQLIGERDALSAELTAERERLAAEQQRFAGELSGLREQAAADVERLGAKLAAERDGLAAQRDEVAAQRDRALAERDALAAEATRLSQQNAELSEGGARATSERERAAQEASRLASEHAALQGQVAALTADNATLVAEAAGLKIEQQSAAQAAEALRDEVRRLEARAVAAEAHAHTLEERLSLPVKVAGRAPLMVPRAASVDRARLCELVCQLVLGRSEVKLELATPDALRTLWLSRGMLAAAESSGAGESLIERARRDGLIDARQEAELRMLRPGSGKEVLDALKGRGYLRQAEVAPLVQRYVEQVALDALAEPSVGYRVSEEAAGPEVLSLEAPRPLLPVLAEALRRALAPGTLVELLGGGDAVPASRESSLDLRSLGFTEKERRLLSFVDGQATVDELTMVAGVKADAAYRALLVARYLGLVEVRPPAGGGAAVDPELDVRRLSAKYEEVQEADYFTILGLSRAAGSDEVQRSFERLSREFDPIRFSGHPDTRLQQQAQVIHRLLEEAARALEDDRRRTEYARHLLD